mmetsp:Transcript_16550/g.46710  ORF Transcript_16550/g.46710 Transcript_16550/m.46710 type:complete len:629 (-) Transcript_16550:71-1957(-)|eukprot:CAMPEP_0119121562 /NCGR_PEP_ID=MMETSP1310-20130426/2136_1 /TAXON_ID=464262 /ORGANISM="Genus nov. species nov., Strain RCC2339" /LENGTH=628 /DNA_ID=CAMNT_0007111133 /DNA_START=114 /DNA_END=2000 /DNA_ORIENTATION=-
MEPIGGVVVEGVSGRLYESTGHGLELRLWGKKPRGLSWNGDFAVNVYGGVWKAAPAGVEFLASTMLPYRVRKERGSVFRRNSTTFELSFFIGTKDNGDFGVSHGRIHSTLASLVGEHGDPPFMLEFSPVSADTTFRFHAFSRASKVMAALDALDPRLNVAEKGDWEQLRPGILRSALGLIRWWLLPILFLAFLWCIALYREQTTELVCQRIFPSDFLGFTEATSVEEVLPVFPRNQLETWQLSNLEAQLTAVEAAGAEGNAHIPAILESASAIVERSVTAKDLHDIPLHIADLMNRRGVLQRIRGFFSFVNVCWLLAIAGITVSVGPAAWVILRPFRELLRRLGQWMWDHVVFPGAMFLHRNGVFELALYYICALFVHTGVEHPAERGFYISLTGLVFSIPAYFYSTALHCKVKAKDPEPFVSISHLWVFFMLAPMAYYYNSSLLGFLAIYSVYAAIGFSVICLGLCYVIGFRSKEALYRVCAASLLLLLGYISLQFAGFQSRWLAPFELPIQVLGTLTLCLGLLIQSSVFYKYGDYGLRQVPVIILLSIFSLIGNLYGLAAMTNTSYVFAVMYLLEKYLEFHTEWKFNGWILLLILSVLLYKGSFFLHTHPEYISDLFQPALSITSQ